ncbi:hypothetical protein ACQZV8_18100, partial [Magnetococcales bacterium HHB-1]
MTSSKNEQTKAEQIKQFRELRQYQGSPAHFWGVFLERCLKLIDAAFGVIAIKKSDETPWSVVSLHPMSIRGELRSKVFISQLQKMADTAQNDGQAIEPIAMDKGDDPRLLIAVRLELPDQDPPGVALFGLEQKKDIPPDHLLSLLLLIIDTPKIYHLSQSRGQLSVDAVKVSESLDVSILMNQQQHHIGASMTLCNEIASRFQCDRVS